MDGNKLKKFAEIISESDNIVFFGGAGVSTESGIPDFRSVDGLYHQKYDFSAERAFPPRAAYPIFVRPTAYLATTTTTFRPRR